MITFTANFAVYCRPLWAIIGVGSSDRLWVHHYPHVRQTRGENLVRLRGHQSRDPFKIIHPDDDLVDVFVCTKIYTLIECHKNIQI